MNDVRPFTALAVVAQLAESQPRILAIDPGTRRSAFVLLNRSGKPVMWDVLPNDELLAHLRINPDSGRVVVIERVASYGMPVGDEVFETVYWSGRFAEACRMSQVERITRKAVVTHLCNASKASDANVRAALIDRFGGMDAAIGRKASPGVMYGMDVDERAALAVACAWMDGAR